MIGAKHAKKMILIGVISLTIMALLLKF